MVRPDKLPLSFAQQRLWLLSKLEDEASIYNMPTALRLHGPLDGDRLANALRQLEARHETLRTSFVEVNGEPYQHIHAPRFACPCRIDRTRRPPEPRA